MLSINFMNSIVNTKRNLTMISLYLFQVPYEQFIAFLLLTYIPNKNLVMHTYQYFYLL